MGISQAVNREKPKEHWPEQASKEACRETVILEAVSIVVYNLDT